jgi:type IV pilus assembly protein PilW
MRQARWHGACVRWRAERERRQRGLSVVDFLVALAASALVLLLAASLLLASNNGFALQSESVALDDGGRYAMEAIGRAVRQAAFINWDADGSASELWSSASASVTGLDAHTLSKTTNGIDDAGADAVNGSDVLALRFGGAGPAPNGDGSVLNCAGFGVPVSSSAAERGWSIFYVGRADDGETELRCKYRTVHGWGAHAVVRGVDSFQVLYGVDTDTPPDGIANTFLTADALNLLDDTLVLEGATAAEREREFNRKTHWKRIVSIRVALLLHGSKTTQIEDAPAVYDLFGKVYSAMHGARDRGAHVSESEMPAELRGRRRQLFETTLVLRNAPL